MNPNALPIDLRHRPQWVCWAFRERDGKRTKVPLDPAHGGVASTADPDTWGTFDDALGVATRPDISGIGFVFTAEDPYVGVDLDDCRDAETGMLTEKAAAILVQLHSYTEVSPSGTGLHVIVKGDLPAGQRRRGSVEMYDEKRFFTMTGDHLDGTPKRITARSAAIRVVHRQHVADPVARIPGERTDVVEPAASSSRSTSHARSLAFEPALDDDDVIERAQAAANGKKFTALWHGDTGGYDSHSEADMALCCLLAFWTDGDPTRVDRLFRQSDLVRAKWDEVHYADGATYGERTVERACARTTETYSSS